jgi:hypothetical protein
MCGNGLGFIYGRSVNSQGRNMRRRRWERIVGLVVVLMGRDCVVFKILCRLVGDLGVYLKRDFACVEVLRGFITRENKCVRLQKRNLAQQQ